MFHLRLVKGKTYWGIVKASEEKPDVYVDEREKAYALVASGFFIIVDDGEKIENESADDADSQFDEQEEEEPAESSFIVELQKKNKEELVKYASVKGIDLTGCTKKDDIFQRIVQEVAKADEIRAAIRG